MRIVFFSAALVASGAALGATAIDGWYSSAFGGYTYMPNTINITHAGLTRNHATYESGFHAGGRFGYKSNPMRYEAEFTYIESDLSGFSINNIKQTHVTGNTNASLAMANVYYDFPNMVPAVQPFLGLGLGVAWVDGIFKSSGPFSYTRYHGSNAAFAYQGTAGFTFNFAENYALNIAYRYVGTDRVDKFGKMFQANLGTVGVIYRFNEIAYK